MINFRNINIPSNFDVNYMSAKHHHSITNAYWRTFSVCSLCEICFILSIVPSSYITNTMTCYSNSISIYIYNYRECKTTWHFEKIPKQNLTPSRFLCALKCNYKQKILLWIKWSYHKCMGPELRSCYLIGERMHYEHVINQELIK